MLQIQFNDYCYVLCHVLLFSLFWAIFIRSNFLNVNVKAAGVDIIKPTEIIKKFHFSAFLQWANLYWFTLLAILISIRGVDIVFLWSQLFLTNWLNNVTLLVILVMGVLVVLVKTLVSNNINYSTDFFFSIINIMLFLLFLFMVGTSYGLVFVLEINSILVIYKFISSKYWYKSKSLIRQKILDLTNRSLPKHYLSMLFFQYWSTFFSSILLFFSIANIYLLYGTTEFILLDILNYININIQYLNNTNYLSFIWMPFVLGFLIKIGLTPFHFFKIEVYKGLPLITVVFYTTFYFFVYFLYFVLILCLHMTSVKILLNSLMYVILTGGAMYIVALIFDLVSLKAFFAYSTIINSVLFLTIVTVL